jgi:hypothetical protein
MLGVTDRRTKHFYKALVGIQMFLMTYFSNNYQYIISSNVNEHITCFVIYSAVSCDFL